MLFSSLEFLYLFLPLTVFTYFICPQRWRNLLLLLLSLVFYAYGEPVYVLLMLTTVTVDHVLGILITSSKNRKKLWLWVGVAVNLSLLFFFKYYDLAANALGLPALGLGLPVGISFYTFQALSYLIDVYKESVEAQKSLVDFGAYVTLFPQLIAGPIVKYSDVEKELKHRTVSVSDIAGGFSIFCAGLAKKVILANGAGEIADRLLLRQSSVLGMWLGIILFAFQIYYDFSGYSDMAVGLGRILGFRFPKNFNYPYISRSITEFWRRWHITLSSFFKEYVYIPLGGNRKGRLRTYFNLFIVWALTGLWHGAQWNFLLWGIYFFILLVIEKTFLLKFLDRLTPLVGHLYSIFFILVGWMIFYAEGDIGVSLSFLSTFFGGEDIPLYESFDAYLLVRYLPFLLIMTVGATPIPKMALDIFKKRFMLVGTALQNVASLGAFLISTAYVTASNYNPFLYFRF